MIWFLLLFLLPKKFLVPTKIVRNIPQYGPESYTPGSLLLAALSALDSFYLESFLSAFFLPGKLRTYLETSQSLSLHSLNPSICSKLQGSNEINGWYQENCDLWCWWYFITESITKHHAAMNHQHFFRNCQNFTHPIIIVIEKWSKTPECT